MEKLEQPKKKKTLNQLKNIVIFMSIKNKRIKLEKKKLIVKLKSKILCMKVILKIHFKNNFIFLNNFLFYKMLKNNFQELFLKFVF